LGGRSMTDPTGKGGAMGFEREVAVLRQAEVMRAQLERIEECLDALSYEDRLVLELLCIHPESGNLTQLCDTLNIEKSSVYRRKYRALHRIRELFVKNGVGSLRDDFSGAAW